MMKKDAAGGWRSIKSYYADDTGVMQFNISTGGTFYVAEGGDKMPQAPPATTPAPLSAADQLLNRLCGLFKDQEAECQAEVKRLRDRGVDDLYIGRQILKWLHENVVDSLEETQASPARKRELVMDLLAAFDEKK